jgi:hypothetical protein
MSKKSWIPAYAGMTRKRITGGTSGGMEFWRVRVGDLFYQDGGGWERI